MAEEKLDTQIRREQIAEAALGLVASQGLSRLNVAAVARRVGLVPSGIYRHFKSKDEILDAVLDLLQQRITAMVQAACQKAEDPLERLRTLLMSHIRFIREGRAIPRMVFSDDLQNGSPERRQRILQILLGYLGQIRQIIEAGQQQGRIRPDLDGETTAMMFFGIVVPAGIRWHLTDGGFDVTKHAERAWQMLRSVLAPE
jgi:AcrR family transcriptional regulator